MRPLDYDQLEQLAKIVRVTPEDAVYSGPVAEWLEPDKIHSVMEYYGDLLRAEDDLTAAVYFVNQLRGLVFAQHFMVSLCERRLDLSVSNLRFHICYEGQYPSISLQVIDLTELDNTRNNGDDHSSEQAQQVLRDFYSLQMRPILEAIAAVGSASIGQMWGQFPLTLLYFKDRVQPSLTDPQDVERFEQDYMYVTRELKGEVFGRKRNPFTVRLIELDNPYRPGENTYMKPSCCQYYKTGGGQRYCYACPKMSASEREERRLEVMASR
ncbi:hypothetical protein PPYC1_02140 [Paenibacillus polymyxa]|uniref:(2Fe-2S)-binding protein n=1 Tax=Paenibacillus TaxID=44249 RepID=UPI0008FAF248|nr:MULTISPECIES: (2Fe-2S)-binding protein [Paenibacillus]APB69252.1 hypothetical protein PPYC1_02140 [Paenibacillus polymyxa]APB73907.1 hypothetical protein PPYC2_02235 [Paenibacillus polymyxa]OMF49677.1 hypothetical protein BK135_04410 [Paenibacillus peoriae]